MNTYHEPYGCQWKDSQPSEADDTKPHYTESSGDYLYKMPDEGAACCTDGEWVAAFWWMKMLGSCGGMDGIWWNMMECEYTYRITYHDLDDIWYIVGIFDEYTFMCSQPDDIQRYLRFPIIVSSQTQQLWDAQSNNWAGYLVQTNSLRLCEVSISEISWVCPKKGDTFGTTIFLLKVTILGYPSISQAMFQHIFHPRQLLQIYQKWWDAKEKYCWEIDYVNKKIRCLEGSAQRKAAALMFCWCWTCLQTVIYHDHTQNREMTIISCAKWASKFWNPNRPPFHDLFGENVAWWICDGACQSGWPSWMSPLACPFGSILGIKVSGFDSNIRSLKYFSELD